MLCDLTNSTCVILLHQFLNQIEHNPYLPNFFEETSFFVIHLIVVSQNTVQ